MNNFELYKKIKLEMEKQNISQSDIAKALNVSRTDISLTLKNLKKGKSITTNKLFSLLGAIGKTFIITNE
ncbi:MAG: XRE family transcriptional regulator [Fusobacterium sp.]|uniref:XRE family transcriptional regulator n=1 Tax=Fusobacterium sp. TaxID=68766 RepID=UPI00399AC1A0